MWAAFLMVQSLFWAWGEGKFPIEGVDLRTPESVRVTSDNREISVQYKMVTEVSKKGLVLVFLSAKCPCSKSHEPVLTKLHREFPEFRFVGVHSNQDESLDLAHTHFREFSFPVIEDKGAKIADAFGALKTPHVYVMTPNGTTVFQGGVDDSKVAERASEHYLKAALEAVRQGKKPVHSEVRTLGCVIQRG